jgi:hypothetical protein
MRTVESLAEQRLLPRSERELFQYEVVRFHLEDLNALAERQKARKGRTYGVHERGRAAVIIKAARWDRIGFMGAIRRFIAEGRAKGSDAFGPGLLLLALRADRKSFESDVSPGILKRAEFLLREIDFETHPPRLAPRPRSSAPSAKDR